MKVGIVTFHYAYNYGAVLQCLALQCVLEQLGIEALEINYLPPDADLGQVPPWRGWGLRTMSFAVGIKKKYFRFRYGGRMRRTFDQFRSENLHVSAPCNSSEEISAVTSDCDALIVGSDQVWRFFRSAMFFLDWGEVYDGKRISYAPCCGHPEQPQEMVSLIKKWLAQFDAISVRNDFSKEIISRLVDQEVAIVADPVLLTDVSDFQRKVDLPFSEYVLVYTLGEEISGGGQINAIKSIRAKVGNLPVVAIISTLHRPYVAPWADVKIYDAGPAEWLWLIANASFVYTDSFHGALFSLKNKKKFLVYYTDPKRAHRILDLAKRYGMGGCVAGTLREAQEKGFGCELDYTHARSLIDEHRAFSISFLKQALDL